MNEINDRGSRRRVPKRRNMLHRQYVPTIACQRACMRDAEERAKSWAGLEIEGWRTDEAIEIKF